MEEKTVKRMYCQNPLCGKRLPVQMGCGNRRRYCNDACQQEAYRLRKDEKGCARRFCKQPEREHEGSPDGGSAMLVCPLFAKEYGAPIVQGELM